MDKYGQIDEWASVIKNQEEGYKKEMERKRIGKFHLSLKFRFPLTIFLLEKRNNQRQYFADLKKGIEDK